jgi:hypothetical protein
MRKLIASLGLCFVFVHAGNAMGQSKAFQPMFDETPVAKAAPQPRQPRLDTARQMSAARIIQQRAVRQAEQRRARISARKWRGISLMRPTHVNEGHGYYDWRFFSGPAWFTPRSLGLAFGR